MCYDFAVDSSLTWVSGSAIAEQVLGQVGDWRNQAVTVGKKARAQTKPSLRNIEILSKFIVKTDFTVYHQQPV